MKFQFESNKSKNFKFFKKSIVDIWILQKQVVTKAWMNIENHPNQMINVINNQSSIHAFLDSDEHHIAKTRLLYDNRRANCYRNW